MNALISIIVPIYNAETYICKCLDSIINQTYRNLEIILIDDGSSDNSGKICDEYSKKDDRVQVIHKDNGGANAARKCGVGIATGELVGFVDSDDWIELDMYEILQKPFAEYNIDVSICTGYEETGSSNKKYLIPLDSGYYDKEKLKKLVYPTMIYGDFPFGRSIHSALWDKLYRRKIIAQFIKASDNEIIVGEDSTILYPTILAADAIYIQSDKHLYHYRQISTSIMHSYRQEFFLKNKRWLEYMLMICSKVAQFDVSEQIFKSFISLVIMSISNEYRVESPLSNLEKRKFIKFVSYDVCVRKGISNLSVYKYPMRKKIMIWLLKHKCVGGLHYVMLLRLYTRKVSS